MRTERRSRTLFALLAGTALVSCARGPTGGELSGWNVLLVTIDTLRADRVGFAGFERADTPVMDELAERGVVFETAIATAPVTLPSHASILTGLNPPAHGALDNGFYSLPSDVPTLAGHLQENRYQTAAVIGSYVLHSRYGLASGFEHYDDDLQAPRGTGQAYRERPAAEVAQRAADWLAHRDRDRPFFLWVHFWDPHAPYLPPTAFAARFQDPYDGEIAYTDQSLGALLDAMRASGDLDRTLIVLTADHGEALGEAGELTHGILLRNATLHVPLVMHAAGVVSGGRRIPGTVSTTDVASTILDLLGLPPLPRTDGRSLVHAIRTGQGEERWAYSETRLPADEYGWSMLAGVRGDRWAWVRAPRPELYDLREDPGELQSVHDAYPAVVSDLDARTQAVLSDAREIVQREELDEGELEALRALGYSFSRQAPEGTGVDPKDMMEVLRDVNLVANALERGQTTYVIDAAAEILQRDPANREASIFLAQALDREGRQDEAIEAARRAFENGGALDLDGTILAMYLAKAGRFDESEALLRAFIAAEPEYAEHRFNLGNLLNQAGRESEAIEAYEQALALHPEGIHILANLAVTLSRRGDERALELIDRAVALAADDIPSLVKIEVCGNLGDVERGMEVARELQKRPRLRRITREDLADAIRKLSES